MNISVIPLTVGPFSGQDQFQTIGQPIFPVRTYTQEEYDSLKEDRDNWREMARILARQLDKE